MASPYGLLGQQGWQGLLGKTGNFLGNNSSTLTTMGAELLNYSRSPVGPIFNQQALAYGIGSDRERGEATKKANLTRKLLTDKFGMSDQEAEAAAGSPELLNLMLGSKTDDTPASERAWQFAQENPEYWDDQIRLREAGRPSTTVNIGDWKIPPNFQLRDPANPMAGVDPIEGGPGEQIPAELAARIGMAGSFLQQAPAIKQELLKGSATGVVDRAQAGWNSSSSQAEVLRKMKSGTDALQRMLTGAGMPMSEAEEYAGRYLPTYTDDAASAAQKLDQLTMELEQMMEMAMRGRGGVPEGGGGLGNLYEKYGLE